MRVLKKVFTIALILVIVLYLGIYIVVWSKGKPLLSQKLSDATGRRVDIGSLYLIPPYTIIIADFQVKDLFFADKVKIEPSLLGFLSGKPGLNKLILYEPKFSLVRTEEDKFSINEVIDKIKSNRDKAEEKEGNPFFVKEAVVCDGAINLEDRVVGLSFSIDRLQLSVITSLMNFKTRFNSEGSIVSNDAKNLGSLSLSGWLDFPKKDMKAKLYLDEVEMAYFAPYFKGLMKKIQSGRLFFTADMVSRDNDLKVDCHLESRDLKFTDDYAVVNTEENKVVLLGNISGLIFDTLIGPSGGGIFDFSIHTRFDRPRLEGLQFKGNIFRGTINNIFKDSSKEGTGETFKKIGDEFEAIGKEFKEQFEDMGDMFKAKVEETQAQVEAQANEAQEGLSSSAPETVQ